MSKSIATRTGDEGTTSLLYGQRVEKTHPQVEALGVCDELNAALGLAKATSGEGGRRGELEVVQRVLVKLMGELACAEEDAGRYAESKFERLDEGDLAWVDGVVAAIEGKDVSFAGWATPGATLHAAALDVARTVARRAERCVAGLPEKGRRPRAVVGRYLNRVSDMLWLMAREAEQGERAG